MKFLYITWLKYCQKLDFEAGPVNKSKPLIIKTNLFDFKTNEFSLFIAMKIYCQKLDFEADPINKFKALL